MNIILVFGGKSVEHDVSVVTAKQIFDIAKIKHNVKLVYIDRNQQYFLYDSEEFNFEDFKKRNKLVGVTIKNKSLYVKNFFGEKKIINIDCALMCCHGGDGESGVVEAHLNSLEIPTTAGSVAALSVAMDKWLTKICLKGQNIKTVPGKKYNSNQDLTKVIEDIQSQIGFPVIVKPCTGGSSIGIEIANNIEECKKSLLVAFKFDDCVVVEKAIEEFDEYNCAVLGDQDKMIVSGIDKPLKKDEILSFKDKYLSGGNKKGMKNQKRSFVENTKLVEKIQQTSRKIFSSLGFYGVIRIDYILDKKSKQLYVNEINAIPGSLAVYFFNRLSMNSITFVDTLIEIAIKNYEKTQKLSKNYITNLF